MLSCMDQPVPFLCLQHSSDLRTVLWAKPSLGNYLWNQEIITLLCLTDCMSLFVREVVYLLASQTLKLPICLEISSILSDTKWSLSEGLLSNFLLDEDTVFKVPETPQCLLTKRFLKDLAWGSWLVYLEMCQGLWPCVTVGPVDVEILGLYLSYPSKSPAGHTLLNMYTPFQHSIAI